MVYIRKMDDANGRGGKRKGAGRKPVKDKKLPITTFIETSKIESVGGEEAVKELIYFTVDKAAKKSKPK